MNIDGYEECYDKLFSFNRDITRIERERILNTINLIPDGVSSVLEVGCGDGRVINSLINKYPDICGLDISNEALKQVKAPKIKGNLEKLPFLDDSYDIVVCCEVLEHLPYNIYEKALKEIERVAKDYILISVPNNENLNNRMIKCPECGCSFHMWRHLRSFNEKKLETLFENFKINKSKKKLLDQFIFHNIINMGASYMKNRNQFPKTSVCPQCAYSPEPTFNNRETSKRGSKLNFITKILPKKKSGGWIITLYNKKL